MHTLSQRTHTLRMQTRLCFLSRFHSCRLTLRTHAHARSHAHTQSHRNNDNTKIKSYRRVTFFLLSHYILSHQNTLHILFYLDGLIPRARHNHSTRMLHANPTTCALSHNLYTNAFAHVHYFFIIITDICLQVWQRSISLHRYSSLVRRQCLRAAVLTRTRPSTRTQVMFYYYNNIQCISAS